MHKYGKNLLIIMSLAFTTAVTAKAPTTPAKAVQEEANEVPLADVQRFTTAISQIKSFYVEPVGDKELFDNAIRGMLEGLDPHSGYLDPDSYSDLKSSTSGKFGGLGIEIDMHEGLVRVVAPLDDTPAARAGMKTGDLIFKIDSTPVKGMKLSEAVKLMRGEPETPIRLGVIREGEKKPLSFKLVREIINIKSVKMKLLDKVYGYIRISNFQDPTAKDLEKAVTRLKSAAGGRLSGLVLDLRNNPGGLLNSAIDVADAFLTPKEIEHDDKIVYTDGRIPGSKYEAKATHGDIINGAPLAVLINGGSASGSEIVAGALQDHHRAVIIGQKTFGKGSVQTVLPIDQDHAIKLTTALYYTPKGRSIQAKGIDPDVVVEDILIPKKDSDKYLDILSISEAELKGHLENGNKDSNTKAKHAVTIEDKPGDDNNQVTKTASGIEETTKALLLHNDFQLYEALNLLQAMTALDKPKKRG